jgi:serine/threonine protein kinase
LKFSFFSGSLKEQINTYGAVPPEVARDFTGQILSGLEYLHSLSIVHRDIKSSNILRHADPPRVKIGDFGSAKQLQAICSEQGVDYEGSCFFFYA